MAEQDTLPRNAKKFLFDQHDFDGDHVEEEEEEEEPPPPTFSEDELVAAKTSAYERGKQDGIRLEKNSRDTETTAILDVISKSFSKLFESEHKRDKQFEAETVSLAHTMIKTLFPVLEKNTGLQEILSVIENVLQTKRDEPEIIIEVAPKHRDAVEEHLQKSIKELGIQCVCSVKGVETVGESDCRMSWENGGASRNAKALLKEIAKQLEHTLADRPTLGDNDSDDLENQPVESGAEKTETDT